MSFQLKEGEQLQPEELKGEQSTLTKKLKLLELDQQPSQLLFQ
jgi:hypothetical protein